MNETGDSGPEQPDSGGGETSPEDPRPSTEDGAQEAPDEDAEVDARDDVRSAMVEQTLGSSGSDVLEAGAPVAARLYEDREHYKIQADRLVAWFERKVGKGDNE